MLRSNPKQSLQNEHTAPNATMATSTMPFSAEGKLDALLSRSRNKFDHYSTASKSLDHASSPTVHTTRSKKRGKDSVQMLPLDFVPSSYTVIVGRGKRIAQTVGNQRLRVLATMFLAEYEKAMNCKAAKTRIVNKIVDAIKCACADSQCQGAFVRYSKGRCYVVDDSVAREKVGYQLRDLLGDKYESSSRSKVAKKERLKQQKRRELQGDDDDVFSHCSSSTSHSSLEDCHSSHAPLHDPNQSTISSVDKDNHSSLVANQHTGASHSRHFKRMSFDAYQLLNQPLNFGRDSITLIDSEYKKVLQEVCEQENLKKGPARESFMVSRIKGNIVD